LDHKFLNLITALPGIFSNDNYFESFAYKLLFPTKFASQFLFRLCYVYAGGKDACWSVLGFLFDISMTILTMIVQWRHSQFGAF